MQHEEHGHPKGSVFGRNSNGMGLFIVAVSAVLLALFCWNFWKSGSKELAHYRLQAAGSGHEAAGHGDHHNAAGADHSAASAVLDPSAMGAYDSVSGNFIFNVGDKVKITLPDSAKTVLEVGANSTESKLFKFLSDAGATVNETDKTQGWITCDRVYFETGKSGLTEASKSQVANLAAILKAFPTAEAKFGGYTDSTGSAATNVKVSGERANAVLNAVKAAGAANKLAAEGYGPQHPIASNSTREGQALNRRVDIRVTKK